MFCDDKVAFLGEWIELKNKTKVSPITEANHLVWIHRPCFLVVLKVGRICGNSGCLTFKRIIHCSSGSDIIWNNLVPFKKGVILLLIKITWFSFEKRNHSRVRHCNFYNSLKSHNLNVSHIIFLNCKSTINCLNGPHSSCLVFVKLSSS